MITKPLTGVMDDPFHQLSQGCIAHWLFNEGAGTLAFDVSGHKKHGAIKSLYPYIQDSGWIGSKFGGGYGFSNTYDRVYCGSDSSLDSEPMTFTFWAKPRRAAMNNALSFFFEKAVVSVNSNNGYYIYFDDRTAASRTNSLGISYDRTGGVATWSKDVFFDSDNWFFIAVVIDPSASNYIEGWKDGIKITPTSRENKSGAHVASIIPLGIGGIAYGTSSKSFCGAIDNIRIYDRVLSAKETKQLYYDPFCNSLKAPAWQRYSPIDTNPRSYGYVFG